MRVRFLVRAVYDTNGPGKGPVYEKGTVHDLRPDEAERWFRRGMAVEAPPEPPEPPPEPTAAPEPTAEPVPAERVVKPAVEHIVGAKNMGPVVRRRFGKDD
jgi:outer membrane biosynthesis protein TonB